MAKPCFQLTPDDSHPSNHTISRLLSHVAAHGHQRSLYYFFLISDGVVLNVAYPSLWWQRTWASRFTCCCWQKKKMCVIDWNFGKFPFLFLQNFSLPVSFFSPLLRRSMRGSVAARERQRILYKNLHNTFEELKRTKIFDTSFSFVTNKSLNASRWRCGPC